MDGRKNNPAVNASEKVKLVQFQRRWGLPNLSPFCMKLETYLRLADIPYEIVWEEDPRGAPKGKLPFIEHQGERIGDTALIIEYLKDAFGDSLDKGLNAGEKATAHALACMFEEHFYWVGIYGRWADDENWPLVRDVFFSQLPFPLKKILPGIIRRKMLRDLKGQGMGLHSGREIYAMGLKDIRAVSEFLDQKNYIMGDHVTSVDATAYAFLANLLLVPVETWLKAEALKLPNLLPYCERMKSRTFPELSS